MEAGYLYHNPAWRAARTLKAEPLEHAVWTADQLSSLLEATASDALSPMWHLIAMTGMRRREVCGLCGLYVRRPRARHY